MATSSSVGQVPGRTAQRTYWRRAEAARNADHRGVRPTARLRPPRASRGQQARMIAFAGPDADGLLRVPLAYRDARAAVLDPRGVIVRSTPTRVTRMQHVSTGQGDIVLFCKVRVGSVAAAEVEWRWLRELNQRGFNVS